MLLQADSTQFGQLLLRDAPPEALEAAGGGFPLTASLLVTLSVLLFLLILRSFLNILPYLFGSVFRARGSAVLDGSVKLSRDRNLVAAVFILPAILLIYRYRLLDVSYFDALSPDMRLLVVGGAFVAYLLVRYLLYRWLMPRRRYDDYQQAYRIGHTFFIVLMLLALTTVGVLSILDFPEVTVRNFLLAETGVLSLLYLFRKAQILSMSCNPLTTFLYLCALELLPAALLVVPTVIL